MFFDCYDSLFQYCKAKMPKDNKRKAGDNIEIIEFPKAIHGKDIATLCNGSFRQ